MSLTCLPCISQVWISRLSQSLTLRFWSLASSYWGVLRTLLKVVNAAHDLPGFQVQLWAEQVCLQLQGSSGLCIGCSGDSVESVQSGLHHFSSETPFLLALQDWDVGCSSDSCCSKLAQVDEVLGPHLTPGRLCGPSQIFQIYCSVVWITALLLSCWR